MISGIFWGLAHGLAGTGTALKAARAGNFVEIDNNIDEIRRFQPLQTLKMVISLTAAAGTPARALPF